MITIIDYGMGNLKSIQRKFDRLEIKSEITSNPEIIRLADKLILPGVGHFKTAMDNLRGLNIINALNEAVTTKQKPILGICLGMQLMTSYSEEGGVNGLGWIEGEVKRFNVHDKIRYKVPHIGWNSVNIESHSKLLNNISNNYFYFIHSYHVDSVNSDNVLTSTRYEYDFVSSIYKDNIFGTQFHPEKSHGKGEQLLINFAKI
ncbi:MAG: imidazole glycerol phosphate synthase subunit HisH [Bacteroidales bacterium]|nr:imidazole glycerol phosphate synthase subunit HisH [Bacteroidales bacterium]